MDRYHRQILLPAIGPTGQERLASAEVLLVGCGALGCGVADQLVRAGVGYLRIIDRDVVELTNLQRQTLFDESDARDGLPKAMAAARHLGRINSGVQIEPVIADLHGGNVESLTEGKKNAAKAISLIMDGTDNAQTRYLINDVAVKHGIPWIYGACIGTEGRMMIIQPGQRPCLRCIFPDPPAPGELPTCDTAGVLGPTAAVVGGLQAAAAIQFLVDGSEMTPAKLISMDVWNGRFHALDLSEERRADCPACGRRQFEFLDAPCPGGAMTLCGRDTIQIRPARESSINLADWAGRLASAGEVRATDLFLRCRLREPAGVSLTLFADGRVLVRGTDDPGRARSIYAHYIGD